MEIYINKYTECDGPFVIYIVNSVIIDIIVIVGRNYLNKWESMCACVCVCAGICFQIPDLEMT